MIKRFLFVSIFLLGCISPLNAEIKKEYSKYDFYAKCLDDALPRKINNGLVWECSMESNKKLDA